MNSVAYDVYLDTTNPPVNRLAEDITTTDVYTGALQLSTPYFWQVVAQDERGRTTAGDVWEFTTGNSANRPPNAPEIYGPNDGEPDVNLLEGMWWFSDSIQIRIMIRLPTPFTSKLKMRPPIH